MPIKTTILVGAGASLAEALPKHPNKTQTPPLDATFFELCRLAKYPGQKSVSDYMRTEFGINPFDGGYGMEEVFNYVYSEAFSPTPSSLCIDAYWNLLGLYRQAISATTNPLKGKSRAGVGHVLRSLLEHNSDRDISFVTFNQDLLIEKAIEYTKSTAKYRQLPWNIKLTYDIPFKKIVGVKNNPTPFNTTDASSIKVLKLHGSMNWVYQVRSGQDPKNSIRKPNTELTIVNDSKIWDRLTTTVSGPKRTRTLDLIPLIVPPIYEKSSYFKDTLSPVWDTTRKTLRETQELVIFGYSFPDADFASKSIIRNCLHHNKSPLKNPVLQKCRDSIPSIRKEDSRTQCPQDLFENIGQVGNDKAQQ